MGYWLFKSEPGCFGIDDLKQKKIAPWDGVRNYQVRNMLRDEIKKGDHVVFYHSSCKEPGAVGLATVAREGYPDHTAWDPSSEHPDPKSTPENPRWYMVDVAYKKTFPRLVSLKEMRTIPALATMLLLAPGSRLSITPLTKKHFDTILKRAGL